MTADIVLVPHTHWDREWYEPFQRFRLRLVALLDGVLDQAEREPRFRFTLDGQVAAVEDYLEVRPENGERLRALVRRGQLAIGPWQILLDEFLCSGENIIRNLEMGITRARDYGGVLPVGYLPDMFGHCAQMPQVLAGAGLRHACVWRGVPAAVTSHAFRWEAPDGSSIRTEYLPLGYSNGAYLFDDSLDVDEQIRSFAAEMQPWYGADGVLAMYGTDHTSPITGLVNLLEEQRSGHAVRVGTLGDYIDGADRGGAELPVVRGELRSHARANILPGVLSARRPLKLALRRAERMVERYAEPWAALYSTNWPQAYLDLAWKRLIESSCHDSVTGCGVDETALQVAARIAEAEQAAQAVRDAVVGGIANRAPAGHAVVVNPSPAYRVGWVELDVRLPAEVDDVALELPDGALAPTQELRRYEPVLWERVQPAGEVLSVFASIHGHELFGSTVLDARVSAEDRALTFRVGPPRASTALDIGRLRRQVAAAVVPGGEWTVRIRQDDRRRVGALVPLPPLGWTAVQPRPGSAPLRGRFAEPVRVQGRTLDNGLLRVTVNDHGAVHVRAADGTQAADVARLVDGGDRGDTYNYGPPGTDAVIAVPVRLAIEVAEQGPLRGVILLQRDYDWPREVDWATDGRSTALEVNATTTYLELRSGEPFLRLAVRVDNRSRDHRLRLHVRLPTPSETSAAEGQFAVVNRGRTAEGGSGETPIPTFPASGFVDAGGVAVLLDRPSEYELLDDGAELAVTLLRSVGRLSRNVHPYRSEPAGPQLDTPEAQCPGESITALAVLPHAGNWWVEGVLAAAEQWSHDPVCTPATGPSSAPELGGTGLQVEGDGAALASLRRRGEWLELRLVAERPESVPVTIAGDITAARRCDLLGRPGEPLDVVAGDVRLLLKPWEIATLQLQREPAGRDDLPSGR